MAELCAWTDSALGLSIEYYSLILSNIKTQCFKKNKWWPFEDRLVTIILQNPGI